MKSIKELFASLNASYLMRQYVFGFICYALLIYINKDTLNAQIIVILTISLLLYPFAMFVYDSIVNFLLGDNIVFKSLGLTIILGVIKTVGIFVFSIFIAPVGIIYLYLTRGKRLENAE